MAQQPQKLLRFIAAHGKDVLHVAYIPLILLLGLRTKDNRGERPKLVSLINPLS